MDKRKLIFTLLCMSTLMLACENTQDTVDEEINSENILHSMEENFETIESFELESTQTDIYLLNNESLSEVYYYEDMLYNEEPFAYWTNYEQAGEEDIAYEETFIDSYRSGPGIIRSSEEETENEDAVVENQLLSTTMVSQNYTEPFRGLFLNDATYLANEQLSSTDIEEVGSNYVITLELTEDVTEAVNHLALPNRFRYTDLNSIEDGVPLPYGDYPYLSETNWNEIYYQFYIDQETYEPRTKEVLVIGTVNINNTDYDYQRELTYNISNINEVDETMIAEKVD